MLVQKLRALHSAPPLRLTSKPTRKTSIYLETLWLAVFYSKYLYNYRLALLKITIIYLELLPCDWNGPASGNGRYFLIGLKPEVHITRSRAFDRIHAKREVTNRIELSLGEFLNGSQWKTERGGKSRAILEISNRFGIKNCFACSSGDLKWSCVNFIAFVTVKNDPC